MDVKGDLRIRRTLQVDRRADEALSNETLVAHRTVVRHDYKFLNLDPNGANRNVVLPDATTLPLGWEISVRHSGSANNLVIQDNAAATLKTISVPSPSLDSRFYTFLLLTSGSAAGTWQITEHNDLGRVVVDFVSGDWSSPSGGYRILSGVEETSLLAANHGKGANPLITVYELVSGNYDRVIVDRERISATGDIEIRITDGAEFNGRIIIQ